MDEPTDETVMEGVMKVGTYDKLEQLKRLVVDMEMDCDEIITQPQSSEKLWEFPVYEARARRDVLRKIKQEIERLQRL